MGFPRTEYSVFGLIGGCRFLPIAAWPANACGGIALLIAALMPPVSPAKSIAAGAPFAISHAALFAKYLVFSTKPFLIKIVSCHSSYYMDHTLSLVLQPHYSIGWN